MALFSVGLTIEDAAVELEQWLLVTDLQGRVVETSAKAAGLFNLTARGLVGRDLLIFFPGGRPQLTKELSAAASGLATEPMHARLFPRGRKCRSVVVTLTARPPGKIAWAIEHPTS